MPDYIVDTSVVSNFAVVAEAKPLAQWLKIAAPSIIEEYRLREEIDLVLDVGE